MPACAQGKAKYPTQLLLCHNCCVKGIVTHNAKQGSCVNTHRQYLGSAKNNTSRLTMHYKWHAKNIQGPRFFLHALFTFASEMHSFYIKSQLKKNNDNAIVSNGKNMTA